MKELISILFALVILMGVLYITVFAEPKNALSIEFIYHPALCGNIPKSSPYYHEDKIVLVVGEKCDMRATVKNMLADAKIEWSVDKDDVISLWCSSQDAPTRVINAVKPGVVNLVAKVSNTDKKAQIKIEVIKKEDEIPAYTSNTYNFFKTGATRPIDKKIIGTHNLGTFFSERSADGKTVIETGKLMREIGINSYRGGLDAQFVPTNSYDESIGERPELAAFRSANGSGITLVLNIPTLDIQGPEDYDTKAEELADSIRYIKTIYDGQLYIELANETYAITAQKRFPKIECYVEFCKKAVTAMREVDPTIVFMAVGIYYASYIDITFDEGNFVSTGVGDPAFTQGYRVQYWNEKIKELVDEGYVQGVTLHPYQACAGNMNGLRAQNLIRAKFATVDMNYFGTLWDSRSFDYNADFYFTEWGQLQGLIYWGEAAGNPLEKKRYNMQKYPLSAITNMKSLMTFMKVGNVKAAHIHGLLGADGFGVVEEMTLNQDYKIPNRIIFEKMGKVVIDTPVFYDISPKDMKYTTIARPWWNGGEDEQIHVADVDAFGFGDESELKQVAFFNQTNLPQKVRLDGAKLKPEWSYGGDIDTIMPEWLINESCDSWAQMTKTFENAEAFTKEPLAYSDSQFGEEIEIPPYTVLFADVEGSADTTVKTAEAKVAALAAYAFKNSMILAVGNSSAYVDNIKKEIDENPNIVPIIDNGRILLPLRFIAENFGYEVNYDEENKGITVKNDTTEIKLTVGEKEYTVNGVEKEFDTPAKVLDGRTLLPIRALAESLEKNVYWDDRGYIFLGTKTYTVDNDITYYFDEIAKLYR